VKADVPTMADHAIALVKRRGWMIFPAHSSGEKKSHKAAAYSNGTRWGATNNLKQIAKDFARWPNAGIGIPCGPENGFFVVEADTLEGHAVDGIASLRSLETEHGQLPVTLMAESPSGSPHRYFKWPRRLAIPASLVSRIGNGVDVIGEAGMVIAPPTLRPGKGVYRWLNDLPLAEAPNWLLQLIEDAIGSPAGTCENNAHIPAEELLAVDPDMVAYGMTLLANDDAPRDEYIKRGMACFGAFGGSEQGFEVWDTWARKSKQKYHGGTAERWRSFRPNRIGAGSIMHWADEAHPGWRDKYWEERVQTIVGEYFAQSSDDAPDAKAETTTQASWPIMEDAAFYGFAGEATNAIAPHSEADPVAILIQILAVAGNIIGRRCYFQVESDRHHGNLFAVLVGSSAKARKGTSFGRVSAVAHVADPLWSADRVKGGLSSGEGLINEVRDPVRKWDAKEQAEVMIDPGIADKRLLVVEPEFAGALAVMERHGNTLSPLLRKAWDGGKLATMTRASPLTATNAHISVIGHITEAELRVRLTRTDAANGFANRFLFPLVRRSKELPFGGDLGDAEIQNIGEKLQANIRSLPIESTVVTMRARNAWAAIYSELSAEKPGMLGAVTARAEAQTLRLAMIYALLDGDLEIDTPHLDAALAVWRYCEASAFHIFGDTTGDPVVDELTRALRAAGAAGPTRTAISELFGRHQGADRIAAALANLLSRGVARSETRSTGGRPTERWFAT
jgi:hypothetical protein